MLYISKAERFKNITNDAVILSIICLALTLDLSLTDSSLTPESSVSVPKKPLCNLETAYSLQYTQKDFQKEH